MKKLIHHGANESKADPRTQEVRWSDPCASFATTTTQVWSWRGGDAIVVVSGYIGQRVNTYVIIRIGSVVHVMATAGLNKAMAAFGYDPGEYEIVTERRSMRKAA